MDELRGLLELLRKCEMEARTACMYLYLHMYVVVSHAHRPPSNPLNTCTPFIPITSDASTYTPYMDLRSWKFARLATDGPWSKEDYVRVVTSTCPVESVTIFQGFPYLIPFPCSGPCVPTDRPPDRQNDNGGDLLV
jgi:hypothetical protein